MLLCLCALVHSQLLQFVETTVRCFCDKQNCKDSLICTGELCLIGFRSEGVVKFSGSSASDETYQFVKNLSNSLFWNTELNSQSSVDSQAHMEQLCSNAGDARDLTKCQHNWNGWQEVCACEEDFCNTFAYLRGSIEESTDNMAELQPSNLNEEETSINSVKRHRGNNLIILLVIIPLSVGALAVCLIFINYHCKMC